MKLLVPNPVFRIILVRTAQVSACGLLAHWLLRWPFTGPAAMGLLVTPVLCLYFAFVFAGAWRWGLPILMRLPGRERIVALTFDDGPSPTVTPRILEILREYEASATFFVLADAARLHPHLVQSAVCDGHAIGLHGNTHEPMVLGGWGATRRQMRRARAEVLSCCPGAAIELLRPPYGFKTIALPFLARAEGLTLCAWSVNPRDYYPQTPQKLAESALLRIRPGAIVLLHDGESAGTTAEALPLILEGLRARGYKLAALTGAIAHLAGRKA